MKERETNKLDDRQQAHKTRDQREDIDRKSSNAQHVTIAEQEKTKRNDNLPFEQDTGSEKIQQRLKHMLRRAIDESNGIQEKEQRKRDEQTPEAAADDNDPTLALRLVNQSPLLNDVASQASLPESTETTAARLPRVPSCPWSRDERQRLAEKRLDDLPGEIDGILASEHHRSPSSAAPMSRSPGEYPPGRWAKITLATAKKRKRKTTRRAGSG